MSERQGASVKAAVNKRQGASSMQPSWANRARSYVKSHTVAAVTSLLRLGQQPLATVMTLTVLAIALMLPVSLLVALNNVTSVGEHWQGSSRMTLYLESTLSEAQGQDLTQQLLQNEQVATARYLSKAHAMEEFKQYSGLGAAVDYLDVNPLPAVIVLEPKDNYFSTKALQQLQLQLQSIDGVDDAELDLAWLQRLLSIMALAQQLVITLAVVLVLGVILVVGNTIRLEIENRRDEILVVKLVGGTDAFVRRPFLYTGFWYGLGAGVLAWLMVFFSVWSLSDAVQALSQLYNSQFQLQGLSGLHVVMLLMGSVLIGMAGAWLAVLRHVREIEPK